MNETTLRNATLLDQAKTYLSPSNIRIFFLGFSAGIPILLIFSSLSIWLTEAGVSKSMVTYFSWAALGYSFKFVWAPLVDRIPLPLLTRLLGRRRSWLLLSQVAIAASILWMGLTDPSLGESSLVVMAWAAVALGFSSATQDIVIDAFRIESDTAEMQAVLSATYIASYRIAMIVSGAGALYLAEYLGSTKESYSYAAWMWTYIAMAGTMLVGIVTTLLSPEPKSNELIESNHSNMHYVRFLGLFVIIVFVFIQGFNVSSEIAISLKDSLEPFTGKPLGHFIVDGLRFLFSFTLAAMSAVLLQKFNFADKEMVRESYIAPLADFFSRYGRSSAITLLALIGLYRISDVVLGVISGVFYLDTGFSKHDIATAVKTVGVLMSILGGFIGGMLTIRFGVTRILFLGALLAAGTNLLFLLLAHVGTHVPLFYLVVSADNLAAGLASAAFVAFLSSLTNIKFTAVQYAIFTSLMTLLPKTIGGYSGTIAENIGYVGFFVFSTIIGLPTLYLVYLADKKLK
ncbi:MAG: hypothetical protein R2827_07485 [Bdellovibrionales bacterium]